MVKLTALVYQNSDSQPKCYTWCFGSALQSLISYLQDRKKVNHDKVLVLIKSSLWLSTEARTLSGFDCRCMGMITGVRIGLYFVSCHLALEQTLSWFSMRLSVKIATWYVMKSIADAIIHLIIVVEDIYSREMTVCLRWLSLHLWNKIAWHQYIFYIQLLWLSSFISSSDKGQ